MKSIIVLMMLISSVSFADKQADKSRADLCFKQLNSMIDSTNAANFGGHGDDTAYNANVKFNNQKATCLNEKSNYERQYGKYTAPKPLNQPYHESNSFQVKQLEQYVCAYRRDVAEGKDPDAQEHLNDVNSQYKKLAHHAFTGHCETSEETDARLRQEEDAKSAALPHFDN